MAYTWTTGEVITADKLNNSGGNFVINFTSTYDETSGEYATTADKTIDEVIAAYDAGQIPLAVIGGQFDLNGSTEEYDPEYCYLSKVYDGRSENDGIEFCFNGTVSLSGPTSDGNLQLERLSANYELSSSEETFIYSSVEFYSLVLST